MTDEKPDPSLCPDPETFLEMIRSATGSALQASFGSSGWDEDARKYLREQLHEDLAKIDHAYQTNLTRYQLAYFTGALLGLRIANRQYLQRLRQLCAENNLPMPGVVN